VSSKPNDLARQAMSAMAWSYAGVAAYISLQVGANIAYARLLGPEQFGLFASGLLAMGILKVVSEFGLGSALTQAESLEPADIRRVFTILLMTGSAACLVLLIGSQPLAHVLREPRLVMILRCFAFALLWFPLSTVCLALLARKLDQKHSQLANVLGYGIGYCGLGLTAAFMGLGAWSPILGFFSQTVISTGVLYRYARPDLRLMFGRCGEQTRLAKFGLRVMLTNVSNWLIYAMDNLLVERLFGTHRFGLYSVAYNVVRTPTDHLVQTIQSVLLPASSRIKEDKRRLGLGYVAALDAVLLVTLPMFATVAALSTTFVETLYGPRWTGAEIVLGPLALAMPMQAVNTVSSALLWGTGFVEKELKIQWTAAGILLVTILACAQISFGAVAWGVLFAYSIRSLLMVGAFLRIIGLPARRIAPALRGGSALAVVISPAMWGLDQWLRQTHASSMQNLLVEALSAAALWIGLLLAGQSLLSTELRAFASEGRRHLLPRIRIWADGNRPRRFL
jgi:O-antigen/teichoic acid export membrane protein